MARITLYSFFYLSLIIICSNTLAGQLKIQTTQKTIVIDPGHGGKDTGLISTFGHAEKDITLALAQRVIKRLEDYYNMISTRSDDRQMDPETRVSIANQNKADLFITIHLNHSPRPVALGYYYQVPDAEELSPQPDETRWKIKPLSFQAQSIKAINSFSDIWTNKNIDIPFHTIGAPIRNLQGTTMPAVLIEPITLSQLPNQNESLESFLNRQAHLMADAIHRYMTSNKK